MSSSNEGAVSEKTCLLSTDEQTSDAEETMANTEVLTEAHIPENRSPERQTGFWSRLRHRGSANDENNDRQRLASTNQPEPINASNVHTEPDEESEEEILHYGAKSVLMLIVPVSICLLVVVTTISSVTYYTTNAGTYLVYTPFHEEGNISHAEKFGQALANALIVIGVILVMTVFLVLLYKFRCYKLIEGWLCLSSLMLLFFFSYIYFHITLSAIDLCWILICYGKADKAKLKLWTTLSSY